MLDAGHTSPFNASMIALTHAHSDHSGNLPWHLHGMSPPVQVLLPSECRQSIIQMVVSGIASSEGRNAFYQEYTAGPSMDGARDKELVDVSNFANFVPLQGGMFKNVTLQKQNIQVETFACDHTVACLGYGFSLTRTRLLEEFRGRNDIAALRKNGVIVQEEYALPVFVFLGDTTHAVLDKTSRIFLYPTIIVECTFLDEEHVATAASTRHMHWNNLRPVVLEHPCNTFVLIHFSSRYSHEYVDEFFGKQGIPNIVIWNNL